MDWALMPSDGIVYFPVASGLERAARAIGRSDGISQAFIFCDPKGSKSIPK